MGAGHRQANHRGLFWQRPPAAMGRSDGSGHRLRRCRGLRLCHGALSAASRRFRQTRVSCSTWSMSIPTNGTNMQRCSRGAGQMALPARSANCLQRLECDGRPRLRHAPCWFRISKPKPSARSRRRAPAKIAALTNGVDLETFSPGNFENPFPSRRTVHRHDRPDGLPPQL